jgi:hypothetical protein
MAAITNDPVKLIFKIVRKSLSIVISPFMLVNDAAQFFYLLRCKLLTA